jgi:hypothetical protein
VNPFRPRHAPVVAAFALQGGNCPQNTQIDADTEEKDSSSASFCVFCGQKTLAILPRCVTFHKQACSLKCCWRGPSCTGRRAWREPSRPLCAASQLSRLASRGCCFLHQIAPNCGGFCQSHEGDGKVAPPSKHPPSPQRLWRAGRSHTEKMRVDAGLCRLVHDKKRGQADFETGFTG